MCSAAQRSMESANELDLLLGMLPPDGGALGLTLKSTKQDQQVRVKKVSAFAQGVGFQPGDVIVAVDATPVQTCTDFLQAWTTAREHIDKVPVQFRVQRVGFDGFLPHVEVDSSDADADTVSLDFSVFLEEDC